jgi:hypothetical protein
MDPQMSHQAMLDLLQISPRQGGTRGGAAAGNGPVIPEPVTLSSWVSSTR